MPTHMTEQAGRLLDLSLDETGQVEADKVKEVLAGIDKAQISHKASLIRAYLKQVQLWQTKHQAVVTSSGHLDKKIQADIARIISTQHAGVSQVVWQENADLIGGITVLIGDTWYDLSMLGQLQTIERQLSR